MTKIEWTDRVWNPTSGCTKVSTGCKNCYAERMANRKMPSSGFVDRSFTEVRCHPERLHLPAHWRKASRIFVDSMSDLFHGDIPEDFIAQVLERVCRSPRHTFQVLTKRPERMLSLMTNGAWKRRILVNSGISPQWGGDEESSGVLAENLWLGVSVENQETADERIPQLIETPAAMRWVSVEPLLEGVDLSFYLGNYGSCDGYVPRMLDWVVIGGESGPGARPFNVKWARSIIAQCKDAEVPVFMKQVGSNPLVWDLTRVRRGGTTRETSKRTKLKDRKGGDPSEWPKDLRVRKFPTLSAPKGDMR